MRSKVIICVAFLVIIAAESGFSQSNTILHRQLVELNKQFKYRGKFVHPRAIKDLTSWVSDPLPGPTAVDVAGTYDSNRYFGDFRIQENGNVFIDLTQPQLEEDGWFSYKHLGRLANGLHVIRTFDNGGGTSVFQSILLVEGVIDYEYKDDGRRKPILIIRRRGEFGIGDRYDGKVLVESKRNRIKVGPDGQNVEKAFTISVRN